MPKFNVIIYEHIEVAYEGIEARDATDAKRKAERAYLRVVNFKPDPRGVDPLGVSVTEREVEAQKVEG